MKEHYWHGEVKRFDDFEDEITSEFIDGATRQGPWAIMTPASFSRNGIGIGVGRGQHYVKQRNGRWLKVRG